MPEILATVILLPLLLGPLAALFWGNRRRTACAVSVAVVTGLSAAALGMLGPTVMAGGEVVAYWPWVPQIGLDVALRLDGLSLLFSAMILLVGLLVVLYANYYLSEDDPAARFYGLLSLFMAAMLGIVLSDNLLLLAVFWELTSLISFLLIGYWGHRERARQGARMALAITGGGGLALLAGLLLIGHIGGTYQISALFGMREQVQADPLFPAALILILIGAFTKSAQVPFHFWLPAAMAAPTPVSAYLHSATMVKAGVFLLVRLYPVLSGNPLFEYVVTTVGLTTLVFAAYVAVFRNDLKGLLAYSTISHLGLIVFLIGLDSPLSTVAAVFHIVNHATFKGSLFMATGIIDHQTGSRDMRKLRGLWHYMPITGTLAIVAAGAMAGVPLLNGFLSKEMFFAEALDLRHDGGLGFVVPVAAVLAGVFGVCYSTRFVHDVFFGPPPVDLPKVPREPPHFMRLPVEILVVACIAVGLAPGRTVSVFVDRAARDVIGMELPPYSIALWHGASGPILMSLIALAGGGLMYYLLQRQYNLHLHAPLEWNGRRLYQRAVEWLLAGSQWATARIANGSLQRYLALLIGAAIVLGAAPLIEHGVSAGARVVLPVDASAVGLWLILIVAALGSVIMHRRRLIALMLAGVVGLIAVLMFLHFSAPDLALTQIAVEVVSTVLVLLALTMLPQSTPRESRPGRRVRDALLAGAAGVGIAALAYAVMTRELETIAGYFLVNAVSGGGGTNVVNVILVDFRGFDTLGEITVLGLAALVVAALGDGMRRHAAAGAPDGSPEYRAFRPLMLRVAAQWLLPLTLLVAAYMFLRGHNQPGGGFVAGLVTAVALLMQYIAFGFEGGAVRVPLDYGKSIGAGLILACCTGLAACLLGGEPFLTSAHGHLQLPLLGEVPLASATVFDLGVYVTVTGATMLTLLRLSGMSMGTVVTAARMKLER